MPNTIAQNLARLVASKTAIAQAITEKGGTVGVNDGFEDFSTAIGTIPSGGGGTTTSMGVRFLDYDGTVLHTYTPEEFANLTEMPANPTHTGLTSQGWNWNLANAKTYVADYGALDIGQMYITDDGKTRLYITLTEGRLSPVLGLCPNGTLTVDWGDGSATETMTGSSISTLKYLPHTYSSTGNYVVTISPDSGSTFGFGQRNSMSTIFCKASNDSADNRYVYLNIVQSILLGDSVTSIGIYAFSGCYSLTSITIPSGVTSIGNYAFNSCYSFTSITIPSGITSIGSSAFQYCYSLTSITIPSGVTNIGSSAFNSCYSLTSITIPSGVTSIGSSAFSGCYSLTSITIPSGVTSIGSSAFNSCYGLGFIHFSSQTPPPVSSSNVFSNISTDCIIYAPALVINLYMNGTNYPSKSTYTYIGYATYTSGDTLPDKTTDETYSLTWYETVEDLKAQTNPITVGNGNEVYATATII